MTDTLTVCWGRDIVGSLALNKQGDSSFSYAETWLAKPAARAISLSLPLRAEPFSRRESRPFFEGLLPEESQRAAIARALGLSTGNEFRLLEALGGEVAGALSLWPEGEQPPVEAPSTQSANPLDDGALIDILNRLPARPMLAGETGLRLSLAGAQTKLPVVVDKGQIALPAPGQASTHILKPPIEHFEGTTENEAFAMRLARQAGLSVAEVDYRCIRGRAFLLVERYDRIAGNGRVKRLHQEDFCQALGFPSSGKYAADGGPVLRDCFRLLRSSATRPAREVLKLFDAAIFNLIIGNADAHAKNYSLLYRDDAIEMAPLYDLLATVAYPDLSPKLAMKIAGRATLNALKAKDWGRFADESGVSRPFVKRRAKALADRVLRVTAQVEAGFDLSERALQKMSEYSSLAAERAARLSRIMG